MDTRVQLPNPTTIMGDGRVIMEPRSLFNYTLRTGALLTAMALRTTGMTITGALRWSTEPMTVSGITMRPDPWSYAPAFTEADVKKRDDLFAMYEALKRQAAAFIPDYPIERKRSGEVQLHYFAKLNAHNRVGKKRKRAKEQLDDRKRAKYEKANTRGKTGCYTKVQSRRSQEQGLL